MGYFVLGLVAGRDNRDDSVRAYDRVQGLR